MKNRLILFIYIIINLCTISVVKAGDYHLLPQPQKFTPSHLNFQVNKVQLSTPVLQQEWETLISEMGGTVSPKATGTIEVKLLPTLPEIPMNQDEAYRLSITKKRIIVEAVTERGVYWAMQTLRQLAEKRNSKTHIQGAEIIDWPAFRVRGFMQDVGRSYISLDELKREIAALAKFKINVFHWHLTENQSWRLESKIFPMLNDSANTTRMPGKYYTLEEAKELVAFCKAHHMTLIPEIDMPGHSAAFIRTFRHDMQSPEGMKILKLLMDEVCETFDVPYLHIGTDEVQFTNPRFVPEMVSYVPVSYTHLDVYKRQTWNGLPATQTAEANYFSRCLSLPPTFRGYNADGEMLLGPNSGDGNQQYNFDKFVRDQNTDKFTMNQSFTVNFMKGLSLKLGAIWYYQEEKDESFNKDYLSSPGNKVTSRSTSAYYDRTLDQTYNAVLNYNYQINKDHYLDAMAGFEYYDSYNKGFNASGSGAPTDDFMDLQYTSKEEGKRSIDSWHSRQRIMSFFGRVNYDYQSKYLLSLVLRKDGYSKLAKENRWGVFPGVSTGWVFSKEKFMANTSDILSFGKLRASFGLNGNVNKNFVGNYTVQGSYGSNTYNGATGFLLGSIPNPYLMWEKSRTFEIGLDLGFLENRINANLTYYNRLTSDKYANITVPSTSGVGSVVSNNGKFQNQGFEFELAFRIIDRKDWKWNLNWNGALNKNKVVALPDNGLERNRQDAYQVYTGYGDAKMWVGGYQEGQRPGDLYMFIADGIYKSQDEIPAGLIDITSGNNGSTGRPLYGGAEGYNKLPDSQKENALPIQPGDVKWKDVNGDGVIDNYDMVKVGNTVPKWTGGFNTTVSWKDLTLSARFDYALGFKAVDWKSMWIMACAQGTYNTIQETKDTWTPDNPNAKYPTYVWADQLGKRNYCRSSSMFVYNGNYLAFRELSLTYRLPSIWVQKAKLSNVELSVTGQNLGYLTEAKHLFSPEKADNNGGYPLPRTVIFGINVSF